MSDEFGDEITPEQLAEAERAAEIAEAEGLRRAPGIGAPVDRYDDSISEETATGVLSRSLEASLPAGTLANPEAQEAIDPELIRDMSDVLRRKPEALRHTDENGINYVLVNDVTTSTSGWVTEDELKAAPTTYERVGDSNETRLRYFDNRIATLGERAQQALRESIGAGETALYTAGNVATAGLLMDAADNEAARAKLKAATEGSPIAATLGGLGGEISSMATLGAGARGAATLLGLAKKASPVAGLSSYLGKRATAAASSSATRGAALAAAQQTPSIGRITTSLAADAAFGEMQAARAQAALDNTELTASQMLSAAGNGVVWGLGLGVGGAMMRGGYRIGRDALKKMGANSASQELTRAQTSTAPEFQSVSDWRRKIREGGEGGIQEVNRWITANEHHLDPELVQAWRKSPTTFATTLRTSTNATGMGKVEQFWGQLEQVESRLSKADIRPPTMRGRQASAEAIAEGAEARRGKGGATRDETVYGQQIAEMSPDLKTVQASKEALAASRNAINNSMSALSNAGGWFGTNAGKDLVDSLKFIVNGMTEQTKASRNLGRGYLGLNRAGEAIQKSLKAAPTDDVKAALQQQLDTLRASQLGSTDGAPGVFGNFGIAVQGNQAGMDGLQGARARLFGVEGEAAPGLLGKNGRPDAEMMAKAQRDEGANLGEISSALGEYQNRLITYVESSPDALRKELKAEAEAISSTIEAIRPGLDARGLARELSEAGQRIQDDGGLFISAPSVVNPPLPPDAAEALDTSTLGGALRNAAQESAADFAISTLPNVISKPYGLVKRLVKDPEVRSRVLESTIEFESKFDRAVKRMQPAFSGAEVTLPPAKVGAAVTRGVGIPTTTELDSMAAREQRETFDRLRADITGLLENPAFAAGMAGMATEGITDVAPELAAQIQMQMSRGLFYLAEEMPQGAIDPLMPGQPGEVSVGEMQSWLTRYRAVNDPLVLLDDLGRGRLRSETAEAVQATHPDVFAQMALAVGESMQGRNVPFPTRVQVGLMMGIPGDNLMTGSALLAFQSAYAGAQTPEESQAIGLSERRRAQSAAAARMPAAARSTAGRYRTISESVEET